MRQLNYCLAAIGANPSRQEERDIAAWTEALTLVLNPALRSFSVGVRSYYFTVAAVLGTGTWADVFGYWSLFLFCAGLCAFGALALTIKSSSFAPGTREL